MAPGPSTRARRSSPALPGAPTRTRGRPRRRHAARQRRAPDPYGCPCRVHGACRAAPVGACTRVSSCSRGTYGRSRRVRTPFAPLPGACTPSSPGGARCLRIPYRSHARLGGALPAGCTARARARSVPGKRRAPPGSSARATAAPAERAMHAPRRPSTPGRHPPQALRTGAPPGSARRRQSARPAAAPARTPHRPAGGVRTRPVGARAVMRDRMIAVREAPGPSRSPRAGPRTLHGHPVQRAAARRRWSRGPVPWRPPGTPRPSRP